MRVAVRSLAAAAWPVLAALLMLLVVSTPAGAGPGPGPGPGPSSNSGSKVKAAKVKRQAITCIVKSVDSAQGILIVTRKIKGADNDLTLKVSAGTQIFWSKTRMKVKLLDLNPGAKIVVQFYEQGKFLVAAKIVLQGGMKEAAEAILKGNVKGGDFSQ